METQLLILRSFELIAIFVWVIIMYQDWKQLSKGMRVLTTIVFIGLILSIIYEVFNLV